MSEHMIRKQIYIPKQQNDLLKHLANQRGTSEAEVIRKALEREVELPDPAPKNSQGYAKMLAFSEERKAKFAGQGEPFQWNRDDLYEERQSRWNELGKPA